MCACPVAKATSDPVGSKGAAGPERVVESAPYATLGAAQPSVAELRGVVAQARKEFEGEPSSPSNANALELGCMLDIKQGYAWKERLRCRVVERGHSKWLRIAIAIVLYSRPVAASDMCREARVLAFDEEHAATMPSGLCAYCFAPREEFFVEIASAL